MAIDYKRATRDEEYARYIKVDGIEYDNYIFIISAMYATTKIDEFIGIIKHDNALFKTLLNDAEVIHCQSWSEAIKEIGYRCNVSLDASKFKCSKDSREWVSKNITPALFNSETLTFEKVIELLSNLQKEQ